MLLKSLQTPPRFPKGGALGSSITPGLSIWIQFVLHLQLYGCNPKVTVNQSHLGEQPTPSSGPAQKAGLSQMAELRGWTTEAELARWCLKRKAWYIPLLG